jgi:acyl-CoA thioester hydrolase
MDSTFKLELDVRDYECDLQGIVNNAVYQHYFEHARHKFLRTLSIDFAQLH